MLEIKELSKIYHPKKGVPVKALDRVSLGFPEKGMVFLLGKSGSGKSTLLNLLGGLDSYDRGEMIIKGVSSKNFAQRDFDSYRNTYVGFIFQEYNVLEEFSVGANIALALELQGKKATDGEINSILDQVDLSGFGARRPNELSGGQLQRVAIARALVKNPEIIMADEPTGALDSSTGRAVLETLKRLSENKLVIVVSHDREFAEKYADRIIELSDGRVIRDVVSSGEGLESSSLEYGEGVISVPGGYHLTEEDRLAINRYIDAWEKGVTLSVEKREGKFVPTDTAAVRPSGNGKFELIKSRLPMKSAFKIGASGLRYKKFRLVMTVLLSTVAFTLFALADTFGSYRHVRACVDSIVDSRINYASVTKAVRMDNVLGREFWDKYSYHLDPEDLQAFEEGAGVHLNGVFVPGVSLDLYGHYDNSVSLTNSDYDVFPRSFRGFSELGEAELEGFGYDLVAGKLPSGDKNEIAISAYMYQFFLRAGYSEKGAAKFERIDSPDDMVGKTLVLGGRDFTVSGVVDTHFDLDRYLPLAEAPDENDEASAASELVDYLLFSEFVYDRNYSHACVAMVGEGFIDSYRDTLADVSEMNCGYMWFLAEELSKSAAAKDFSFEVSPKYVGLLEAVPSESIVWLDGERGTLGEKELIIADDSFSCWGEINGVDASKYASDTKEFLGMVGELRVLGHSDKLEGDIDEDGWRIVGYIDSAKAPGYSGTAVLPKEYYNLVHEYRGLYEFAVGNMPRDKAEVTKLVTYCYDGEDGVQHNLQNPAVYELDVVNGVLDVLSKVFLYVGIGFALFAALLLANFIATSISYKKQEIGILRAIGSRSADVFRIFFSESFIIASVNFLFSAVLSGVITVVVNYAIRRSTGVLVTVLHFGVRQVLLLGVVCLAVAAAASFVPVQRIASKKPIDAIRNK